MLFTTTSSFSLLPQATQAAKKPKGDGSQANDPYPGPSLVHEHSLGDGIPGVSNSAFSKAASSFPVPLPGHASGPLSLDSIASMQGSSYTFTAPSDWPQDTGGRSEGGGYSLKTDALGLQQGASLSLQHSSLNPHRPDKTMEFNTIKLEHKAVAGGGSNSSPRLPRKCPWTSTERSMLPSWRCSRNANRQSNRLWSLRAGMPIYPLSSQTTGNTCSPTLTQGAAAAPLHLLLK